MTSESRAANCVAHQGEMPRHSAPRHLYTLTTRHLDTSTLHCTACFALTFGCYSRAAWTPSISDQRLIECFHDDQDFEQRRLRRCLVSRKVFRLVRSTGQCRLSHPLVLSSTVQVPGGRSVVVALSCVRVQFKTLLKAATAMLALTHSCNF